MRIRTWRSFGPGQQADRPEARDVGVVVDHDGAVPGRVDVELHAVGVQHDRAPEGRAGVLVLVAGGTTVGDHTGTSHGA